MSITINVKEGQPAPDFTLPAVGSDDIVKNGQVHLADLKGRNVVLYFYPKDDTPGCTKEACSFRDANYLLQQRGVVVLGISADSVVSHQKFADEYGLPFPLLSDSETSVSQLYGVYGEKQESSASTSYSPLTTPEISTALKPL